MVKLEEVVDEEFMREQEGPNDDDDWDTNSGMHIPVLAASVLSSLFSRLRRENDTTFLPLFLRQNPTLRLHIASSPTKRSTSASLLCKI